MRKPIAAITQPQTDSDTLKNVSAENSIRSEKRRPRSVPPARSLRNANRRSFRFSLTDNSARGYDWAVHAAQCRLRAARYLRRYLFCAEFGILRALIHKKCLKISSPLTANWASIARWLWTPVGCLSSAETSSSTAIFAVTVNVPWSSLCWRMYCFRVCRPHHVWFNFGERSQRQSTIEARSTAAH
jgi:hypothetical protein